METTLARTLPMRKLSSGGWLLPPFEIAILMCYSKKIRTKPSPSKKDISNKETETQSVLLTFLKNSFSLMTLSEKGRCSHRMMKNRPNTLLRSKYNK